MIKICETKKIISIFFILYITSVSAQVFRSELCGGLHSGVNPCKECSDSQLSFVKAQTLPRVITTSVNQVARPSHARRDYHKSLQSSVQTLNNYQPRVRSFVRNVKPRFLVQEKAMTYTPQVQQEIFNVDSNVKLAPRFDPIGDPCFKKKESRSGVISKLIDTPIVTPANPPKINCLIGPPSVTSSNSNLLSNTIIQNKMAFDDLTNQRVSQVSGVVSSKGRWKPITKHVNKLRGETAVERSMESYAQSRFNMGNEGAIRSSIPVIRSSMYNNVNTYSGPRTYGVPPMRSFTGMTYIPAMNSRALSSVQSSYGASSQSYGSNCQESSGISFDAQENIYKGEPHQGDALGTADPVSVAIMYKKMVEPLQKRVTIVGGTSSSSSVSEEKLSFGPKNIPINGQVEVTFKEIPEEKLHIVEKPVVELKLKQSTASRSLEETVRPLPTYRDLGYQIKTPEVQTVVDLPRATLNYPKHTIVQVSNTLPEICIEQPPTTTVIKEETVDVRPLVSNFTPGQVFLTNVEDNSAHQLAQQQNYGSSFDYMNEQQKDKQIYQDYQMRSQDISQSSTMINNDQYVPMNNHPLNCVCTV